MNSRHTEYKKECKISDGMLLVDKPPGMTSHDVVDFIRKRFKFKKVGHAGTLDPMATGLLLILLGKFTKKSAEFSFYDKEYDAKLCLGVVTDTCDSEGNIVSRKDISLYGEKIKDIEKIFTFFKGEILQIPPMYSAKKIKGKKLYEFARKGVVLERKPEKVIIKKIEITDITLPYVTFCVRCSKGTYVRQLAHDIGERLGCGAHLAYLRRTAIGPFRIEDAKPLSEISNENILRPE